MNDASTPPIGSHAPGPRGDWLIGNVRDFQRDVLGTMARDFATHGAVVRYQFGPRRVYMLSHPDLAQEVFVDRGNEFLKPRQHEMLGIMLGNGLLTNADHDLWLAQRRMMQPMFHRQRLTTMAAKMTAAGTRMLERWQARPLGEPVDIAAEMMQVTLDSTTQAMFSADVLGMADIVGSAVGVATHFVTDRMRSPFSPPLHWPTPRNRVFKQAMQTLDRIVAGIVAHRRSGSELHDDLLDMLLHVRDADTGVGMSDTQLRDEVLTIFAAGHETTANALTWAWYALAQHPDTLAQLHTEVDNVLQGRMPSVDDLPNLPYAQQVFNEVLRLYPPVPTVPRRVAAATTLHGYAVPADALVFVSIYNIQRHPAFWPQPTTFDPQRWEEERAHRQHGLAFMPFGGGPRRCIGNNFALMKSQLLLALIAQHYDMRLVPEQQVVAEVAVTMRPKDGLMMTLHPRA